jgi:hypothetical protein
MLLVVVLLAAQVFGYSNYPGTCNPNNMPQGGHNVANTPDGNGKFTLKVGGATVTSYIPGQPLSVTYTTNVAIGGFVYYTKDANGVFVGSWTPGGNQALISSFGVSGQTGGTNDCNKGSFAVGHTTFINSGSVTSTFNPPTGAGTLTLTMISCPQRGGCFLNTVAVPAGQIMTTAQPTTALGTTGMPTTGKPPLGTTAPVTTAVPTTANPTTGMGFVPTTNAVPTPASSPAQGGNINGQNLQGNNAPALSQNAIIGIAVGGTLGLLVLIVLVTPCIYAVARKDDPRVQRMTNRFTNAFGRA